MRFYFVSTSGRRSNKKKIIFHLLGQVLNLNVCVQNSMSVPWSWHDKNIITASCGRELCCSNSSRQECKEGFLSLQINSTARPSLEPGGREIYRFMNVYLDQC